jgi:hypothetical protein
LFAGCDGGCHFVRHGNRWVAFTDWLLSDEPGDAKLIAVK